MTALTIALTDSTQGDDPLAALQGSIPGVPGEDYPVYAEVPETAFSCDGQVDGGKYATLARNIYTVATLKRETVSFQNHREDPYSGCL